MVKVGLLYGCTVVLCGALGIKEAHAWMPYSVSAARFGLVYGGAIGFFYAHLAYLHGRDQGAWS